MGGLYETNINGLRFHKNKDDIHIHNDISKDKFISNATYFKKEVKKAFSTLLKKEGIIRIKGDNGSYFYILKDEGFYSISISRKSIKRNLESFIRNI